ASAAHAADQPQWGRAWSRNMVSAEGRLYFLDDAGTMHVVRAGSEFEVLARNDLGEECRASPAISGGQIFLRGLRHLFAIAKGDETQ
ncbi:unnamed protein product, partial [marine sediment metagenome]